MSKVHRDNEESLPPKTFAKAAEEISKILRMGWIDIPPDKAFNGNAAPGDFLEHLLGGSRNNRDSPDLMDWEVKFHGGTALLTLFHKEPSPRGVMRQLVHKYGWEDDLNRISFRHTLGGTSEMGFYVVNDSDRVLVRNRNSDDTNIPHWTHTTLENSALFKLRRLILVDGEYSSRNRRVIYRGASAYWEFNVRSFIQAIVDGVVYIDFDARTQKGRGTALRNHGTKFRINTKNIQQLYLHHRVIR